MFPSEENSELTYPIFRHWSSGHDSLFVFTENVSLHLHHPLNPCSALASTSTAAFRRPGPQPRSCGNHPKLPSEVCVILFLLLAEDPSVWWWRTVGMLLFSLSSFFLNRDHFIIVLLNSIENMVTRFRCKLKKKWLRKSIIALFGPILEDLQVVFAQE